MASSLATVALPNNFSDVTTLFDRLPPEVAGHTRSPQFDRISPERSTVGYGEARRIAGIGNALLRIQAIDVARGDFFPPNWTGGHVIAFITSWLTLAPKNKVSGGRLLSSRTQPSANRAAAMLRLAATSLGRTQTALGAFYRRLATRIGKPQAVTATARKLAILIYHVLKGDFVYRDPGADAYDAQQRARILRRLRQRADQLGFTL